MAVRVLCTLMLALTLPAAQAQEGGRAQEGAQALRSPQEQQGGAQGKGTAGGTSAAALGSDAGGPAATLVSASSAPGGYLGGSGGAGEAYVLGRGGRCEDHELGRMELDQRLAGANLERLSTAQAYLAPGFSPGTRRTPVYILANYQQELEQARPKLDLAGTYLGLLATRRVSADVVVKVNNLLCLATAQTQAEIISRSAESQRLDGR